MNTPLARAIVKAAEDRGGLTVPRANGFSSSPAVGVTATVDGHEIRVGGPPRLLEEVGAQEVPAATAWRDEGAIILHVIRDGKVLGGLRLADEIRPPESREAVDALHKLGVHVVMITGDAEAVANSVGHELGIDRVFAGVRPPEDKASKVAALQHEGKKVAMVGDGVNDAPPALAQADVGIAIGAGTDVAIASAGVILASSDPPRSVLSVIELSRASYRKMKQNLWWGAPGTTSSQCPPWLLACWHPSASCCPCRSAPSSCHCQRSSSRSTRNFCAASIWRPRRAPVPFSTVRRRPAMWSIRRPCEVRIAAPNQVELRTKMSECSRRSKFSVIRRPPVPSDAP